MTKNYIKPFSIIVMSWFYISAGLLHFTNTNWFLQIVPPYLPLKLELVYVSGFFEIIGGFGVLVARLRKLAGWGLLALLISVYPANIYMALNPELFPEYSISLLYFRLALQFLFFYWAYTVTLPEYNK